MGKSVSNTVPILMSLILVFFVAGCGDSGKSGTQTGVGTSLSRNQIKLALKPGVRVLFIHFSNLDKQALDNQSQVILNTLASNGVAIEKHVINSPPTGPLFVRFSTDKEVVVNIDKTNLDSIQAESSAGTIATWEKGQSELQYKN